MVEKKLFNAVGSAVLATAGSQKEINELLGGNAMNNRVNRSCETCRHWKRCGDHFGQCRAESPKVICLCESPSMKFDKSHHRKAAVWPESAYDDYCGKWTPDPLGHAFDTVRA